MSRQELARWSEDVARRRVEEALTAVGYQEIEIDQRGFRSGALNELSTGAPLSRH
jgi:hypothetical protein